MSASPERASQGSTIEVRTAAHAAMIPTLRAVVADLAGRADFDLDAISDLRMAVDEACATLVAVAAPGSELTCTFTVFAELIEVDATVTVPPGASTGMVATDSFGWRVLQTLADNVTLLDLPEAVQGAYRVGIRFEKRATTDQR